MGSSEGAVRVPQDREREGGDGAGQDRDGNHPADRVPPGTPSAISLSVRK